MEVRRAGLALRAAASGQPMLLSRALSLWRQSNAGGLSSSHPRLLARHVATVPPTRDSSADSTRLTSPAPAPVGQPQAPRPSARPSISRPGRSSQRPPLPQSWAEKLRAKNNRPALPGSPPEKPNPATSGDPTDIANLIDWDASEFLSRGPGQGPSMLEKMQLRSTTGRTVRVGGNVDLPRALAQLGGVVGRNRIAHRARLQRFHERPGLKRKRLKSERWRERFKEGFRAAVLRAKELNRQGW